MALESLLETAFSRGCGISRRHALRTARYKEIVDEGRRIPNTTLAETSEMIYLGERLADRAFRNLPYSIRSRAVQWQAMSDLERRELLDWLMTKLSSSRWRRRDGRNASSKPIQSALPHETGSWYRGSYMPNCLGMSQMLIGFARATGARHLMIDTIVQRDAYLEQQLFQTSDRMIKLLEPVQDDHGLRRVSRRLESIRERSLKTLDWATRNKQAHHALAIMVGEQWMVVDPYMQRIYPLTALGQKRLQGIDTTILRRPRFRWMFIGCRSDALDIQMGLEAFERALTAYARRSEPVTAFSLGEAIADVSAPLAWIGVNIKEKTLPKSRQDDAWHQAWMQACFTRAQINEWNETDTKPKTFVGLELIQRAQRLKRHRDASLKRLVRYVATCCLVTLYEAREKLDGEHQTIEIAHPTSHLAVMTLNHIARHTETCNAELIRFDSSQWIVHDTLEAVAASSNAKLMRIIDTQLRSTLKHRTFSLAENVAHAEHRK